MLAFDTPTHRFNLRAAAIVLSDAKILLHRLAQDNYWSLPGGRVEPGESAAESIIREFREELNERLSAKSCCT